MDQFHKLAMLGLLLGGLASPEGRATLRFTGIVDAYPSGLDENNDPPAIFYKAVEIFADSAITSTELNKYAVRIFYNADPDILNSATIQFDDQLTGLTLNQFDYGYIVRDEIAFGQMYRAGGPSGNNWANNSGQTSASYPKILASGGGTASFGGNEVYQLLYFPAGFAGVDPPVVRDTLGVLGDPNAQAETPPWPWNYDHSWAYRKDGTGPSPTFNSSHWNYGGPGLFSEDPDPTAPNTLTVEETAAVVPFGTFQIPEPSSFGLVLAGALLLRRRLGLRGVGA